MNSKVSKVFGKSDGQKLTRQVMAGDTPDERHVERG